MIHVCCSLFDRKLEAYSRPMFVPHINAAIRGLGDELSQKDSELGKHPDDYDLYDLGTFDDASGQFDLLKVPKFAVSLSSLIKS